MDVGSPARRQRGLDSILVQRPTEVRLDLAKFHVRWRRHLLGSVRQANQRGDLLQGDYQKMIGGATAQAVFAGKDANHRGTFLYAVRDQKDWFDELLSSRKN
jgi:hypothetical protein